jgi:small-conductance mechanosensitive channel
MSVLEVVFLGNPVSAWLIALAIFFAVFLVERILIRNLRRLSRATETVADDVLIAVLEKTHQLFLVIVAAFAAFQVLELPPQADGAIRKILVVAVLAQGGIWVSSALSQWLGVLRQKRADRDEAATWLSGLEWAGKLVIWSLVVLIGLENLGVDVGGLMAGLGIGGIAVALAVQNILGDLFASLSIYLDQPFVVGDFLAVDDYLGSVEDIGLKTTRLRSLSGEQLVFSNGDLLKSRIRNYGRMYERRVVFSVGVTYDTPPEKVEKIPNIIRESIEAQENTRFDRAHFKQFGDFALVVETVYYVLVPDYGVYMDIQQAVNLALLHRFHEEGIDFAYPTQTLLLKNEGDRSPTSDS